MNKNVWRQQLSDIPTRELMQECERRVKDRVPTLVNQIQDAFKELNSLGIKVCGDAPGYAKFICSEVTYNLSDKEVVIDLR